MNVQMCFAYPPLLRFCSNKRSCGTSPLLNFIFPSSNWCGGFQALHVGRISWPVSSSVQVLFTPYAFIFKWWELPGTPWLSELPGRNKVNWDNIKTFSPPFLSFIYLFLFTFFHLGNNNWTGTLRRQLSVFWKEPQFCSHQNFKF